MATAIREIELSAPLKPIEDLGAYRRVMLVLRLRGRIVGRAFAEAPGGRIDVAELSRLVEEANSWPLWETWLHDELHWDQRASAGTPRPTATVAICTRERPEDLSRTLAGVMALDYEGHDVMVVDNAPLSDRTRRVVSQYARVRYVVEPRPGLNIARNRALSEARGEIVAFTDDDAVPEPGWLAALVANFGDPRVLCVTGLTLPIELETDAQELFEEHCSFARGFLRHVFDGQRDNPLHVGPVGAGANMAVRRGIVARVGAFDERLDGGTPAQSGGDHEIFTRILAAGYQIVYDPAAVSWHRHRRTNEQLLSTVHGYGVGVYAMWTKLLLERRELGVLKLAWLWFRHGHLPVLMRRLRGRPQRTTPLVIAEIRGCLRGPAAWFAASRQSRMAGR